MPVNCLEEHNHHHIVHYIYLKVTYTIFTVSSAATRFWKKTCLHKSSSTSSPSGGEVASEFSLIQHIDYMAPGGDVPVVHHSPARLIFLSPVQSAWLWLTKERTPPPATRRMRGGPTTWSDTGRLRHSSTGSEARVSGHPGPRLPEGEEILHWALHDLSVGF